MARRKRRFLDDGDDTSDISEDEEMNGEYQGEDPDARDERQLFENPYKRKKMSNKKDSICGVFGEDDEDGDYDRQRNNRLRFTKAPAFVSGEKSAELDKTPDEMTIEKKDDGDDGDDDAGQDGDSDSETFSHEGNSEPLNEEPVPQMRVEEQEEEERPRMGLGRSSFLSGESKVTDTFRPMARDGGHSRKGIGSSQSMDSSEKLAAQFSVRGVSGSAANQPRSFLRDSSGSAPNSRSATPNLTREEKLHFSRLQNSFGAKLMAKMGWQSGTGLGASGDGIVTPIETKLRPKASMGLAFGGHTERTKQSIIEEKRRKGEPIEELLEGEKGKGTREKKPKAEMWKKPRKRKIVVEHKTYEQILQDAGQNVQTGIGKIYDATSGEMREISSLAEVATASWTPTTDSMRIPEVRHNLRLLVDAAKIELDELTKDAKTLEERRKWVPTEDARLRRKIQEEAELISRLQDIHLIVDDIETQTGKNSYDYELSLEAFSPCIERLTTQFQKEYNLYGLDEIIIAAIAPVVRRLLASWKPLEDPTYLVDIFKKWRKAFRFTVPEGRDDMQVDIYREKASGPPTTMKMTPYESLMWNVWLPNIRSTINNEWSAWEVDPAVRLYEVWSGLLPPFIRDNFMDQLIIPKVHKATSEWQPRVGEPALQSVVFPWLPHIGLRVDVLLEDAKRKIKTLLRNWVINDGVPTDLAVWKEIFGLSDWDSMLLKYIVPKLGVTLREEFRVNPRRQEMAPLQRVLAWHPLLRPSFTSQLMEMEFFPKWLDVLHIWLIQPNVNLGEIRQWYSFWKEEALPQDIVKLPDVMKGFTQGLQMMNMALDLGKDAATKLPKPERHVPARVATDANTPSVKVQTTQPSRPVEVTFRSIVEDHAASHDLLFIPTGRAHEKSRMPLFRVSKSVDGKSGILVYILDDVVWLVEGNESTAISLNDMVIRATKLK